MFDPDVQTQSVTADRAPECAWPAGSEVSASPDERVQLRESDLPAESYYMESKNQVTATAAVPDDLRRFSNLNPL